MRPIKALRAGLANSSGERGIVLVTAFLLLVILLPLAIVFLNMTFTESTVASKGVDATKGFGIAEAGIEHARRQLRDTDIDALLLAGGNLFSAQAFGGGSYSVTVSNNLNPPFPRGSIPADPGGATDDTDNILIITSTGVYKDVSRSIEAVVSASPVSLDYRGVLAPIDPMNNNGVDAFFSGSSFTAQGQDTLMPSASDPANLPAGCSATPTTENKLGVSLTSQAAVNNFTAAAQNAGVDASFKGLNPGSTTNEYVEQGSWDYDPDFSTTAADLQALVGALMPGATSLPTGGPYGENLGTPSNPGVFVADGNIDLKGSGKGYGILIVTGELKITGNYTWEGLVLVVGAGQARITGSDNEVFGAILVVSTGQGATTLETAGNGGVYYSSQALCRVQQAGLLGIQKVALLAWREV